mmetsp:Transcript_14068/g.35118  ORF Transcript_14068/g.35118 Transcript_14068/m.35118 type:complete len:105 (-) Transcript_14068:126-440(-)
MSAERSVLDWEGESHDHCAQNWEQISEVGILGLSGGPPQVTVHAKSENERRARSVLLDAALILTCGRPSEAKDSHTPADIVGTGRELLVSYHDMYYGRDPFLIN